MKKIFLFFLMMFFLSAWEVSAQQTCNPDPNKLITGVPYCDFLKFDSTSTTPNPINNKSLKERDSLLQQKLEIFTILNGNKISPHSNNTNKTYQSPPINPPANNLNLNQANNNDLLQTVPNNPSDNMPVEIPNSTNNQSNQDLPNNSNYY